jgi:hypothetical protein
MAGGGPPSTSLLITAGKDVDAGMTIPPPPEGHRQRRLVSFDGYRGSTVIPAKAGTQRWVPAFAGMTEGLELSPLGTTRDPVRCRRHFHRDGRTCPGRDGNGWLHSGRAGRPAAVELAMTMVTPPAGAPPTASRIRTQPPPVAAPHQRQDARSIESPAACRPCRNRTAG